MFAWWGRVVVRGRWAVLVAGVLFAVVGGVWGTGVFGAVSQGGFDDPNSESTRAAQRIVAEIGRQDTDVLALYTSPDRTVDDPAFRDAVTARIAALRQRTDVVAQVVSYYDTGNPVFVSADRHSTYTAIRLVNGGSTDALAAIRGDLPAPGLRTQIGGPTAINADITDQVTSD